ncbi:MAG: AEC family transporter [Eubacteriales bacterium]|jgi:predicted permease
MWDNFLYSINVILPVFILVALGYILKRLNFFSEGYLTTADKLVFNLFLPSLMFLGTAESRLEESAGHMPLILFVCAGITIGFVLSGLFIPLFVRENEKRGAMIQGSFRANFSILGMPLAAAMFGQNGVAMMVMLTPSVTLLYNIYSVVALIIFAPREKKPGFARTAGAIVVSTIKNPLIIAVVLGLPFMIWEIPLPGFAGDSLGYLADATFAVSLISLGANISGMKISGKIKYSFAVSLVKVVILPVIMVVSAWLLGFRGEELGLVLVIFGSPAAVASYIMAKNMGSDGELAGQILLITSMLCPITVFLGVFIMRSLGWL